MKATVHVAGPAQLGGLHQQCARCGYALQDYTGGQPMVVDGEDPGLPTWPEGQRVAVAGNAAWVVQPGTPVDADEAECRPAS